MQFKPEGGQNKSNELNPESIENSDAFRDAFNNAKNQLQGLIIDKVSSGKFTFEELQDINQKADEKHPYVPFEEYIKRERNQTMDSEIKQKHQLMITLYDDLINRIKSPSNLQDFEKVVGDIKIFLAGKF